MTSTHYNNDGLLVIDAGPVVLESSTVLGEQDTEQDGEVADDDVCNPAGE